uniref:Ubiquinol-cytochrome-c reductase complex assembly factor 3 n=1 Tax=Amphimedon queenslandica TaxID=400682 RepID=A0A1X7VWJ9_AMPQE
MARQAIKSLALVGGITGVGWALMTYVSPKSEEVKKKLPEDEVRKAKDRNEMIFQHLQEVARSKEPFWKIKPPQFDNTDNIKTNSSSVTK